MSHSLYEVARHPEVQAKLLAEVDTLNGRRPEFDDIQNLPYTEAVFQASCRVLSTSAPFSSLSSADAEAIWPRDGRMMSSSYTLGHVQPRPQIST